MAGALGWPGDSLLTPANERGLTGWSWIYLAVLGTGFVLYALGAAVLAGRQDASPRVALVVALAVQLVPLTAPVLLSTDVYTYWAYGRIASVHGGNPYSDVPADYPDDPAYSRMGRQWRETTSVYGPAFTLASEGHAAAVGTSPAAAAWTYKTLAALAMVALAWLASRLARRKAFAAAFVGWNPLLAIHFAGGGHNDSWMMALVLAALMLAAAGRRELAGVAWVAGIAIKWVALLFLPLRALEARHQGRQVGHLGFALAAALFAALGFWRYGTAWLGALGPVADNLEEHADYSIPMRVASLGVPETASVALFAALFGVAYLWLLWQAWGGRARLALAAGLLLIATPWLVPWYAVWAVPLAAVEEDTPAQVLALALSAYLLRDAVVL